MLLTKHINGWKLPTKVGKFLLKILNLIYSKEINKGDTIQCHGIGYPHWKGEEFICTEKFNDDYIGIKGAIRVSSKDFRKIKTTP